MKYVALLRGIGPANPNMRNKKLAEVFIKLGFKNVQTVISSGNVLFESSSKNVPSIETKIENALPFKSVAIVRSLEELNKFANKNPFGKNAKHGSKSYLLVTFLKNKPRQKLKYDRAVCSIVDLKNSRTPQVMSDLEKKFGKEITTRTWQTVQRIINKSKNSPIDR
jgi:uncharacterized protein (DUF1697 family)